MVLGSGGIKNMLNMFKNIFMQSRTWLGHLAVNPANGNTCDLHKLNLHCLESFVVERK
jgi:hypothetical protein